MRVQCSTCLELLTPGDDLTSTPCGHVFHMACVIQWFENKKNCPQCRQSANERNLRKIYLAETDGEPEVDADNLQNQLDSAKFQLRCKEGERSKFAEKNKEVEEMLRKQKEELKTLERSRQKYKEQADALRTQSRALQEERFRYEEARREVEELRHKLESFKSVELSIRGQEGELNKFLHERGAFDSKTRDLATLVVMLKQKMADVKKERCVADSRLREVSREQGMDKRKVRELEVQVAEMESINRSLEGELWKCQEEMKASKDKVECLGRGEAPHLSPDISPPPSQHSPPSPPPVSTTQPHKLPSYKLACSVKRPLSPDSDRIPLLPLLNHSSSRLAVAGGGQGAVRPGSGQPHTSLTKHYDGLGGRARLDQFPQPRTTQFSSQQGKAKQAKTVQYKAPLGGKQTRTIDKFFGSFDTP
eukprot:GFUD01008445.1.p1 GENE.GFUD01008445.1~~GFUD01008445.1.p1  ORF type:complete len:419 (-),score=157.21 GFUD01008445.1:144-1400(-)